jgi:hypothetical protein
MAQKYYCGPRWLPGFAKRILSYKFNASCKVHDSNYESHCFTRIETDIRFLKNMMDQSDGSLFWEMIAMIYFLIVRICGRLSW